MFWTIINDGPFVPKLISPHLVDILFKRWVRMSKYWYGGNLASSGNNYTYTYALWLMWTWMGIQFWGLLLPFAKYNYDNATTVHSFASLWGGEFTTVTPGNRLATMTYPNSVSQNLTWTTQKVQNRYVLAWLFFSQFFNEQTVTIPVWVIRNSVASNGNYSIHTRSAGTYTGTVTVYEKTSGGSIVSRGSDTTTITGAAISAAVGQVTENTNFLCSVTLTWTPAEDSILYIEVEINFSSFNITYAGSTPGFTYDWQVGLYHADEIKPTNIVLIN